METKTTDTMATDGKFVYYSQDYVDQNSLKIIVTTLAEEVYHVIMGHHLRIGQRDLNIWNVACDMAIYSRLKYAGFELDDSFLPPPSGCEEFSAERLYEMLIKEQHKNEQEKEKGNVSDKRDDPELPKGDDGKSDKKDSPDGGESEASGSDNKGAESDKRGSDENGQGSGTGESDSDGLPTKTEQALSSTKSSRGGVIPQFDYETGEPQTEAQAKADEADINARKMTAAIMGGKNWGHVPADLKAQIAAFGKRQVNYLDLLRDLLDQIVRSDYSWRRPNRRYVDKGIYLPSIGVRKPLDIVCGVDVSGSVTIPELQVYAYQLSNVLEDFESIKLHVFFCNAAITARREYSNDNLPISFDVGIGGGTDFKPVFKAVENFEIEPKLLLYYTDLCVGKYEYPKKHPDYPVIWLNTKPKEKVSFPPPFGTIINLDVNA